MRYKDKMIILFFLIILKLYFVCKIFIKFNKIKYNKKNLLKKNFIKIFSLNWEYIIIFNNFIGILEVFIYQKSFPISNEFNQAIDARNKWLLAASCRLLPQSYK